jgi:hypothetical protein
VWFAQGAWSNYCRDTAVEDSTSLIRSFDEALLLYVTGEARVTQLIEHAMSAAKEQWPEVPGVSLQQTALLSKSSPTPLLDPAQK